MIPITSLLIVLFIPTFSGGVDWKSFRNNYVPIELPQLRIIGGDEAVPHSYPFVVGLVINENAFCGGTLLTKNYVLTAAHCAVAMSTVEVILGVHNIYKNESTQVRMEVENITVHEDFDSGTYQNDIAVLKLKTEAPINDFIQLVDFPERSHENDTHDNGGVVVLGWGFTDEHVPEKSEVLMYTNVTVLDLESCRSFFGNSPDLINELNICTTGYRNRGTCKGDSGGPLILDKKQIGITSFGTTLCEICSPSVYTNVAKYYDWLDENTDLKNRTSEGVFAALPALGSVLVLAVLALCL